jgi:Acetyltransferase (GNAT) domain
MEAAIRLIQAAQSPPTDAHGSRNSPLPPKSGQLASLFHEAWWLKAASGGRYSEVTIEEGNATVARLPFVVSRRYGFTILKMPPFTHTLGPAVHCGNGKYQTLLKNRIKLTRRLVERLPRFDYFRQSCDPNCDNGLALADGLAFQDCGFHVATQYTFHIDCRKSQETLLGEMSLKSRQHVRMAEKANTAIPIYDPDIFVEFYLRSLRRRGLQSNIPLEWFANLYSECRTRDCGKILAAVDAKGAPVAMTFVVWDRRAMYYLLSARLPDVPDKGAVNLLIWTAMKTANELGLIFDLDGVSTAGTAQFLAGFGGEIGTRLIVSSARPLYSTFQHAGRLFGLGNTSSHT